jgi:hypothetical protein
MVCSNLNYFDDEPSSAAFTASACDLYIPPQRGAIPVAWYQTVLFPGILIGIAM